MIEIKDLLGNTRYLVEGGKAENERKTLLKWFVKKTESEGKRVAIQLGHYKEIGMLYALQSQFKDRERNKGLTYAQKWFWWFTKTKKAGSPASS